MKIKPARRIVGQLRMPGDKSISHRAAIMSALSIGPTWIENFSTGRDCSSTLSCLRDLGVNILQRGTDIEIEGVGLKGLRAPIAPLDCGNSGSTMRMLAGVLAGQDFVSELTGDESLRARPMNRIIEPLRVMGANIDSIDGHAPLRIKGRPPLDPISYLMPIASAQVKTCVLLAGLNAEGRTEVLESENSTRDHTERILRWLAVPVTHEKMLGDRMDLDSISVTGPARLSARGGVIPGDISSAAFFIAAAAALPGSKLTINGVGFNPTRTGIISTLRELGILAIGISYDARSQSVDSDGAAFFGWGPPEYDDFNEPFGNVDVTGDPQLVTVAERRLNDLSGLLIPKLIDELPMLAVIGTKMPGGLTIRNAAELRLKETDRISATVKNLQAMGAQVEEHDDGLTIKECPTLHGAKLNSYGDHRIAMAFSIAALIADGESELVGAECVGVSFPEFYELLESVVQR